jgi:hypothetical protein
MAITKDVNSYVTVVEADAYFLDKLDSAAWEESTLDRKAQALVTATGILDEVRWGGMVVSDSQLLAFPRNGTYFDPRIGHLMTLSSAVALKRLSDATFELAYHLLNNEGLMEDTGLLKDISLGAINLSGIRAANKIPPLAKRLIRPMMVNGGGNAWYRSN